MKYVDIHCHLDSKDFEADREEVLARMRGQGVGAITIGADLESSKRAVEIAENNENVWACIGVHPEYSTSPLTPLLDLGEGKHLSRNSNFGLNSFGFPSPEQGEGWVGFEELIKSPKVVGIGECGLDYFRLKDESEKVKQKELFESQIQFAIKHDKPLMLHIRDAYNDALDILENYKKNSLVGGGEKLRGNVHFFAGSIEVAKKFLDLDFTLSFTGVITFLPSRSSAKAGACDYDEVIKYLPSNSIMSETDAPWVAPVPFRGKRNEPAYVVEVVKKMSLIKEEDEEELRRQILENSKKIFNLSF